MSEFDKACDVYIDHSAYVWSGQGENICAEKIEKNGSMILDPEGWIKSKETSTANANRAIDTYRRRIAEGSNPVYAVDCSGYTCKVLEALGLIKQGADYNTKGLYALCRTHPTRAELRKGDLVFHSKTGKAADIHHVGFYMGDGYVSESRGRNYGVVVTAFDDHPADWDEPWNMYGRIDGMDAFTEDEPEVPYIFDLTSPRQKGDKVEALQWFLNFCNYPDENGNALTEDGILGPHSWAALEMFSAYYAPKLPPPVPHTVTICTEPFTVTVDGAELTEGGGEE